MNNIQKQQSVLPQYQVEQILDEQLIGGKVHYLIKWMNMPNTKNTWQPEQHLLNAKQYLTKWKKLQKKLQISQSQNDEEFLPDKKLVKMKKTERKQKSIKNKKKNPKKPNQKQKQPKQKLCPEESKRYDQSTISMNHKQSKGKVQYDKQETENQPQPKIEQIIKLEEQSNQDSRLKVVGQVRLIDIKRIIHITSFKNVRLCMVQINGANVYTTYRIIKRAKPQLILQYYENIE